VLIRVLLLFFVILVVYIVFAFLNPFPKKNTVYGFKPKYGVSYSFEQAGWLGLDPREAYVRLLDTTHFDWVRLPFFWDGMTDENGELRVEDLEFAIIEAKKRDVKVVIAMGAKVPYYPEYHLPQNINSQLKFGDTIGVTHAIADDLLEIDRKLVEKLAAYDNISHWQVENEPLLANVNNWKITPELVGREVEIVRSADPKKRPIILSHVGPAVFDRKWKKLEPFLKEGDILGVNAYFKTQGINLFSFGLFGKVLAVGWPRGLVWPVQSWYGFSPNYASLKNEFAKKGIGLWIMEMQAEPYIRTFEDARKSKYFYKPEDITKADEYLKSVRMENVGLWGAPFWLYREKIGDKSWLNSVKILAN
jgi:hypothetical protein